ncbi:unnamed protein product [Laminaria digitata]
MFNAFKLHRAPHDNRYFVYKIENDAEIVVDTFGDKSKTYDDFTACLPPNECRYGVFDLDFTTLDGRQGNKLIFISWSPDTADQEQDGVRCVEGERWRGGGGTRGDQVRPHGHWHPPSGDGPGRA